MDVTGTQTLSYGEAIDRWLGIAGRLSELGIRKFVMLNAHGGNSPLMTIVATEARVRFDMLAVATSWTRFGVPAGYHFAGGEGDRHPRRRHRNLGHAGALSEQVDMSKAADFPSRQTEFAVRLEASARLRRACFGWKMSDLNTQGVAGNAAAATAEKGRH